MERESQGNPYSWYDDDDDDLGMNSAIPYFTESTSSREITEVKQR